MKIFLPTEEELVEELEAYFPSYDREKIRRQLRSPTAGFLYNFKWLPEIGCGYVAQTVRCWVLSSPFRAWKWLARTSRALPPSLRKVLALPTVACESVAVVLGRARQFEREEDLLDMYRVGLIEDYIFGLMRHSYYDTRPSALIELLARCAPPADGLRVLDYGSGVAAYSLALAEAGCVVTLLDVEGELSEFALWRFQRRGFPVRFLSHADPLPSVSFDLVLCLDVLEHLLRPMEAIRRIHEALAEQGHLLLSFPDEWGHGYGHIKEAHEDWKRHHGDAFLKGAFNLICEAEGIRLVRRV